MLFVTIAIGAGWGRYASVKPVGNLSRKDVIEIRRVVYRAEYSQMQVQSKSVWVHLRCLPMTIKCRVRTRILGMAEESDGSVTVQSISGLWGKQNHRVERKGGKWVYKGIKLKDPNIIIL